jgi:hypothetical protein
MIAHHRIGADIDREQGRKQANPVNNPLPSMFVTLTGVMVYST